MNFDQLKAFHKIALTGGFTKLENVEAAKRIVEDGYGITIVCKKAAEREIKEGRYPLHPKPI